MMKISEIGGTAFIGSAIVAGQDIAKVDAPTYFVRPKPEGLAQTYIFVDEFPNVTLLACGKPDITTFLESYLPDGALNVIHVGRAHDRLVTCPYASLLGTKIFIRTLQSHQGVQTGSHYETAYQQGRLSSESRDIRTEVLTQKCPWNISYLIAVKNGWKI